jgi:protein-S-isoprenylcysteine O-methyltransferase Ste14
MVTKFGVVFLLIGLLLFLSAGSVAYTNGWIFIITLAAPMSVFGALMLVKDPAALERRLQSKEPDIKQKAIITAGGLMFIVLFVLAGVDYRFEWSRMPFTVTITAVTIMLVGYGMFVAVMLQNSYASRSVDVYKDQKIITAGLYSLVRHPLYLASLFVFLSIPFILGSWLAVIPMLFYPAILVQRIKNEEILLIRELDGYSDYVKKVRYRLLPFIW